MRIERLDLTAFGCFTGRSLDLSAPGVHIVAGPNEAGKSTARYAVGQLLYGIDVRTTYNFVHANADMRLGALLRDARGEALEIVRHKRTNNPLTTRDGSPLPERELIRVLADVGADEFRRVFALDHDELRGGGDDLLAGKGDVGRALFESRSSSRLAEVQQALLDRSAELWRPNGKRRINNAVKEIRELRRQVAGLELDPRDFAVAEKDVDNAAEEYTRRENDLRELRARHSLLTQVRTALPQLLKRAELVARIAEEAEAGPVVADETAAELERVTARLLTARGDTAHDRAALAETEHELAALAADTVHLAHAEALDALYAEARAVRESVDQLAATEAELRDLRARAQQLLDTVRTGRSVDDPDAYALPAGLTDRIAALRHERAVLDTASAGAREHAERRADKHAAAVAALAAAPPVPDRDPLRALRGAVPEGLAGDILRQDARVTELTAKADTLRARHGLGDVPDAILVRLPTPSRAEIDEHRAALDALRTTTEATAARRETVAGRLDTARRELGPLLRSDAAPTEAELRTARTERDALWAELRSARTVPDNRAAAFARAVAHADDIADGIRHRAAESLRRAHLEAAVDHDRALLAELDAASAESARRRADLAAAWDALWRAWPPVGLTPPGPAGADRLIDAVAELTGVLAELDPARRALEELRTREADLVARFRTELDRAGAPTEATALRELTGLADLRVTALTEALRDREAAEEHVRTAAAELDEARTALRAAEEARAHGDEAWHEIAHATGLADADPDALTAAVETLADVARKAREIADATARRDESAARVADFDARLAAVLAAAPQTAPAAGPNRFDQLARHHEALVRERKARDARELLDTRAERLRRRIETGDAVAAAAANELAALVEAAGVDDENALRDAVARTLRLRALRDERAASEGLLLDTGMPIPELESLARDWTGPELDAALEQLATDVARAEEAYTAQSAELGRVRQVLDAIDDSARAAQAQEAATARVAELSVDVEQYVRLELAREVLLRCIEDYRRDNQAPVLTRAEALFAALTGGRFTRLVTETEAKSGKAVLKALRAGRGNRRDGVGVEAMSEGTRDQLYLALRLATLERYADAERTMPLILDDIAMTFDDGRTGALLRVLDAMADRFQVVLFTHHEHLADLARAALPEGRAHVHGLPAFASGPPPA
ncbi:ATP-binding protein [Yinghuangia sp. ASG 101]|uniref:ATP-binding protein n=1 Tax=Yinghuangia sp. ASG 101 TaxID=2896848 RepID=UPI0022B23E12|nr:YhaN family protein [Yinghuangia sp. ASG 101]